MTDIVMDTFNRLPELRRTMESILERTVSPYRLHPIDDASTEGNADYLLSLWREGRLASLTLRHERRGIPANWNAAAAMGSSEILVYTNGDVICPKLDPDWLAHGLGAMQRYPDLGLLSLNSPMCTANRSWKVIERRKDVVICDRVPSFFLFARRSLMRQVWIPDVGGAVAGIPILPTYKAIDRAWSQAVQARGYVVGYLSAVYCEHIGIRSVRNGRDLSRWAITPLDAETLTPPEEYRG